MKNLLTILCCVIAVSSFAQITSKALDQDSILYLTPEQEAFMIDKETKSLFKNWPLAYERKLSKQFSVNIELQPVIHVSDSSDGPIGLGLESNVEVRNYYKLPRLIKQGKQANNLSSSYLGAGVGYDTRLLGEVSGLFENEKRIFIVAGEQKRFLNYGYVNFGFRLSYSKSDYRENDLFNVGRDVRGVTLSRFSNVGFALGKTYKISEETKCPIFKCHLDRKSAFKINYNRKFEVFYGDDFFEDDGNIFSVELNPSISYERKIASSSFSAVTNLDVHFEYATNGEKETIIDYKIGSRYYYNLKKNIAAGKSGNNLSGFYALTRFRYVNSNIERLGLKEPNGELILEESEGTYLNLDVGIGYQKTLLNNVFFDIDLAVSPRLITFRSSMFDLEERIFLNFKAGKYF